jgi:hemerythrin
MLLENLHLVDLDSMNEVHKAEVEILENLYSAVLEKDISATDQQLELFFNDVKQHFEGEEKKMVDHKFPMIMKHKMAHLNAIMELSKAKKDWELNKNPENIQDYLEKCI